MLPAEGWTTYTLLPPQEVYKTVSMRLNIVTPDLSGEWRIAPGMEPRYGWGEGAAALGSKGGFLRPSSLRSSQKDAS